MAPQGMIDKTVAVKAENIGGIEQTEVSLPPGVSVLTGRNATNRSSFLQAIMTALGSDQASLKADAEEGSVELQLGDDVHTRTLTRHDDTVQFSGDPYLEGAEQADLFAFLLENNEARRAVERGDNLREVIMRPVDTSQIERDIEAAEQHKRDLDDEIERLDRRQNELPDLKSERSAVEDELEETRQELTEVEGRLEEVDIDPAKSKDRKEELEAVFTDLREKRTELEDIEYELETERATVEELEAERDELETKLERGETNETSTDDLEGRITELRTHKRSLDETISKLQSIIGFNEEMLEGDGFDAEHVIDGAAESQDGTVTDQLVADDSTTCWTCGSEVERDRIESTVERLRSLRSEKLSERNDIVDEIEELKAERKEVRETKQDRQRAERRFEEVKNELERTRERIDEMETERVSVQEKIEELEAETEEFEDTDYSETLDLHRQANRLELEIERLESNLEELDDRIDEIEGELDERETLQERRESVQSELTDLRTRVDRIEEESVGSFNDHIESILEILEYENIERIWIERREAEVRDGRRTVTRSEFELHVIRSSDGSAYRDSVDHLSESEREVTGLVFALAGYLVHDVHEEVPFMLLDSLEAIDSDRIANLIDYFENHVAYLVVALLPEDAQALDDEVKFIEGL